MDEVTIEIVGANRADGTGGRDTRNPHPEGKVPLLMHDDVMVWESTAIVLYLAELFPKAGLGIPPGDARRGAYISWLAWYAGVVEPIFVIQATGLKHPIFDTTFRGVAEIKARLTQALADKPFLTGDSFTAADLLLHTPWAWFGKPGDPIIDAWVDRCTARPGALYAAAFDAEHMAG